MKVSRRGLVSIMRDEGVVLPAYRDAVGVWTVGVGHTAAAGAPKPVAGMKLTLAECLDLLATDIVKYEDGVNRAIKVPLKQHEFDALVSFHFNTGAINKASLTKAVNGKKGAAAIVAGFNAYTKGGGRTLSALVKRRKEEADLFLSGDYGSSKVPVWAKYPGKSKAVDGNKLLGEAPDAEARAPDLFKQAMESKDNPIARGVQADHVQMGYYEVGEVDGDFGGKTAAAITAFKLDRGVPGQGVIDKALIDAIDKAKAENFRRPIAKARKEATPEDLAPKLPEVKASKDGEKVGFWAGIGTLITTLIGGVVDFFGDATDKLSPIKDFAADLPTYVWLIAALSVAGVLFYLSRRAGDAKTSATVAYQEGART